MSKITPPSLPIRFLTPSYTTPLKAQHPCCNPKEIINWGHLQQNCFSIEKSILEMGKCLVEKLTIPCRFIGSKFLSLPEIVIRIVIFVKNWICNRTQGRIEEIMTKTGYSLETLPLPRSMSMKALKFARLDAAVHTDNIEWLPSNCTYITDYVHEGLKVALIKEVCTKENSLVTFKRMHVVFGAKGAEGTKIYDTMNVLKVVWNMLGGISDNYFKAEEAYLSLRKKHPTLFKDCKIDFSGLCLGGSLAAFVGLRQSEMGHTKKVFAMNSVGLSPSAQWHIGREKLRNATKLITLVSAEGDFASAPPFLFRIIDVFLNFLGFLTIGNYGKRYIIPHAKEHDLQVDKFYRIIPAIIERFDKIHCLFLSSIARYIYPKISVRPNGTIDKYLLPR